MRRTYREGVCITSSRYLFLAFFRAFRKRGRTGNAAMPASATPQAAQAAPLVSVLTASYNYERWLPEAAHSVLAQTFGDLELLLLEDGSSDGSADVARAIAAGDARARVLFHPGGGNRGLPATLRLGLEHARGTWIAFLEADDVWLPRALEARLDAARRHDAGLVFCGIDPLVHDAAALDWFEGYVPRVLRGHGRAQRAARAGGRPWGLAGNCLVENPIPTFSCALVRADVLRACQWEAPVPRWLDWWIWCQLALGADATAETEGRPPVAAAFVPEALVRWRLHGASQHHTPGASYLADQARMARALRRLPGLRLSPLQRAFLALPAPLRLAVRAARMMAHESPLAVSRRVRRRLGV